MTVELERAPHLWARALAATVLVMSGATAAHTWAGGHLPGLPALLALAGVVLGGGLLFLSGLLGWRLLLPAVAIAQTGLHGAFGVLGSSAEHAAHAVSIQGATAQSSWQMLAAHATGTALTALVWWLCDRTVLAVLVALRLRPAYAASPRPLLASPERPVRVALVHLLAAPHRGPPVAAARA